MLAALRRAHEHVTGFGIAIKPQQGENRPGAAGDHVEALVGGDQFVAQQHRRRPCVGKQGMVVEALRHRCEGIDDRTQADGAAESEGTRQARSAWAFQLFANLGDGGERQLF